MGFIDEHCVPDEASVLYDIEHNAKLCVGCGLCAAFCPTDVFEMRAITAEETAAGDTRKETPVVVFPERCVGCETCTGQCPMNALRIHGEAPAVDPFEGRTIAPHIPADEAAQYKEWSDVLKDVLKLRDNPIAIHLVKAGDDIPDVPVASERMRYCQSLALARLGRRIMLPPNRHACPDGTSILGMTSVPPKLASGELYLLFHKLETLEAAQQMVAERPHLPERSVDATVVEPLDKTVCTPDVVAVIGNPEQMMWLCMSAAYYTGHRFEFHTSGYNSQCVETTLYPMTTNKMNISFGCYGIRAASDLGDDMMFMGIPLSDMPTVVQGLRELSKRAIPQSRSKIYLPPL